MATGEMGIGNTTTSSAMAAVFLNQPVPELTGRGAGLSSEGLARKIAAIEKAIAINQPDPSDPIDVAGKGRRFLTLPAWRVSFLQGLHMAFRL